MSILSVEPSGTSKLRVWICLAALVAAATLIKSASSGPAAETQNAPATTAPATTAPAVALSQPVLVGKLTPPGLAESSGLIASRKYAGVYWSINDSGNPPALYAVDSTGKDLGSISLTGAKNTDWEDIAIDAEGILSIADVGDNSLQRKVLTIYAVGEPDPKGESETAAVKCEYRFAYPPDHGPFDCEAMFVHKGWAYLITKEIRRARLYRIRLDGVSALAGKILQAEDLGLLGSAQWVTAADISPDGMKIAALSYLGIWVYQLDKPIDKAVAAWKATTQPAATTQTSPATRPAQILTAKPLKRGVMLRQAEAICFEAGQPTKSLLITNEHREVYRILLVSTTASKPSSP